MDFCSEKSDVRGLAERLARVNSGIGIKGLVGGACAESGESVRTKICLRAIAGSPRGLPPSWLALADCLCRWLGRAGEVPPVRLPGAVTGVWPPLDATSSAHASQVVELSQPHPPDELSSSPLAGTPTGVRLTS